MKRKIEQDLYPRKQHKMAKYDSNCLFGILQGYVLSENVSTLTITKHLLETPALYNDPQAHPYLLENARWFCHNIPVDDCGYVPASVKFFGILSKTYSTSEILTNMSPTSKEWNCCINRVTLFTKVLCSGTLTDDEIATICNNHKIIIPKVCSESVYRFIVESNRLKLYAYLVCRASLEPNASINLQLMEAVIR